MMKPGRPTPPIANVVVPATEEREDDNRYGSFDDDSIFVEYDPVTPNEYLELCRERRAERERMQRERERQEFLRQSEAQSKEPEPMDLKMSGEDAYMRRIRMSGLAPAPDAIKPTEPASRTRSPSPEPLPPPSSSSEPIAKQSVAQRLMAKMGWSNGQGLGAQSQGIKHALVATKCVNGHVVVIEPASKRKKQKVVAEEEDGVVLLENMVGKGEVDGELERETAEECSRFGLVRKCIVRELESGVRIFVHFDNMTAVKAAIEGLNGRTFAGRKVRATSYDLPSFIERTYDL
uniref:G-patch domain-containing protein n=1 Tax=Spongospora subterranea TaxID=70186 RepID=A0A0H5RB49_9EUKA|eukprot:CRZ10837.1 hypothetical protein [Spongospora subterranea]